MRVSAWFFDHPEKFSSASGLHLSLSLSAEIHSQGNADQLSLSHIWRKEKEGMNSIAVQGIQDCIEF